MRRILNGHTLLLVLIAIGLAIVAMGATTFFMRPEPRVEAIYTTQSELRWAVDEEHGMLCYWVEGPKGDVSGLLCSPLSIVEQFR